MAGSPSPLRKVSVSESVKVPGCASLKILLSVTAYHSFSGEVESLNTLTIRRLTTLCLHQLPRLHGVAGTIGRITGQASTSLRAKKASA
jgi:hypothetical protein